MKENWKDVVILVLAMALSFLIGGSLKAKRIEQMFVEREQLMVMKVQLERYFSRARQINYNDLNSIGLRFDPPKPPQQAPEDSTR